MKRNIIYIDCDKTEEEEETEKVITVESIPLFPIEIRHKIYGYFLRQGGTKEETFSMCNILRQIEPWTVYFVHDFVTSILKSIYRTKGIDGLSIRDASKIIDNIPCYTATVSDLEDPRSGNTEAEILQSIRETWEVYSLIMYYIKSNQYPIDWFDGDDVHKSETYFRPHDSISNYFYYDRKKKKVIPLNQIPNLYVLEGIKRKDNEFKQQVRDYIETFKDKDRKNELNQLLLKCKTTHSRGFFFNMLLKDSDDVDYDRLPEDKALKKDLLSRTNSFPLSFKKEIKSNQLVDIVLQIGDDDDDRDLLKTPLEYKYFLTSQNKHVMNIKNNIFRGVNISTVEKAKIAHRLYKCRDKMDKRRTLL